MGGALLAHSGTALWDARRYGMLGEAAGPDPNWERQIQGVRPSDIDCRDHDVPAVAVTLSRLLAPTLKEGHGQETAAAERLHPRRRAGRG